MRNEDMAKRVFISVGSLEAGEPGRMVMNVEDLVRRLTQRQYPSLDLDHYVFPGETHVSGLGTAHNRGLKFVHQEDN